MKLVDSFSVVLSCHFKTPPVTTPIRKKTASFHVQGFSSVVGRVESHSSNGFTGL